jgi:hypothetical protein
MKYQIPEIENNGCEIPPITILPESGESAVDLGVKVACAVIEKYCYSRKDPFFKEKILSKEGKVRIRHHLRHTGRIRIRASHLKLRIKKGQLKLNVAHWLHCHKDPDPEKALSFFNEIMRDIAREEATPEETQEIIVQSAIEAWKPSKSF